MTRPWVSHVTFCENWVVWETTDSSMLVLDSFGVAFSFSLWKIQPFHYKVDDYHWGRLVLELNAVGMRHAGYNVNEELGECEEKTPWKLLRIIWIILLQLIEWVERASTFLEKRPFKEIEIQNCFPKKTKRCHLNKQLMLSWFELFISCQEYFALVGEALIMALRKHVNGFLVRNIEEEKAAEKKNGSFKDGLCWKSNFDGLWGGVL